MLFRHGNGLFLERCSHGVIEPVHESEVGNQRYDLDNLSVVWYPMPAWDSGVDFFFRNSQHPSCKSSSICPGSGIFVRPINRVGPLVGCSRLPHGSCRQSLVEVRSGKENKCIEVVAEAEFNAAFVGAGEIAILEPPFFMLRQKGGIRCEEREGEIETST